MNEGEFLHQEYLARDRITGNSPFTDLMFPYKFGCDPDTITGVAGEEVPFEKHSLNIYFFDPCEYESHEVPEFVLAESQEKAIEVFCKARHGTYLGSRRSVPEDNTGAILHSINFGPEPSVYFLEGGTYKFIITEVENIQPGILYRDFN